MTDGEACPPGWIDITSALADRYPFGIKGNLTGGSGENINLGGLRGADGHLHSDSHNHDTSVAVITSYTEPCGQAGVRNRNYTTATGHVHSVALTYASTLTDTTSANNRMPYIAVRFCEKQ